MRPLAEFPVTLRQRNPLRVDRHRRHADHRRPADGAAAYAALERLRDSGLRVDPGDRPARPAGAIMIARFWPVDAVVGENGAFYFRYDHGARAMTRRYLARARPSAPTAPRGSTALAGEILAAVPGARIAADQPYRDRRSRDRFSRGCRAAAAATRSTASSRCSRRRGATAKVSSIHVNGWFGDWDKLAMTRTPVRARRTGSTSTRQRETVAFIGDSPNDAPMFGVFPASPSRSPISGRILDRIDDAARLCHRGRGGRGLCRIRRHAAARERPVRSR